MRKIYILIPCLFLLSLFSVRASALEALPDTVLDAVPEEALGLLEDMGLSADSKELFFEISPEKALNAVKELVSGQMKQPIKTAVACISVMIISCLLTSFLPSSASLGAAGEKIPLLCLMFIIVSAVGDVFSECCSAVLLTEDFMLTLIPVFGGIVSFGGNPSLAISFNTVAFAFSETVTAFFNGVFPALGVFLLSVSSASAINPAVNMSSIGSTASKCVNLLMAFVSGIFVAVMSVRGVIAGAADSVTIRGVRFLIGNSVPIVGSAIGEALNSVVAGLGLIKNTVGMIGIAAIAVINLPVLIKVALWKLMLQLICLSSELLGNNDIKDFSRNVSGVLSVATGALCFVSFVFIISIAILLTISKG